MDRDPKKLRDWQRRSNPLEKKTGLKPGKPLRRSARLSSKTGLKTKTPLSPKNAARIERRRKAGLIYGPYYDSVKALDCWLAEHPDHRCRFFPRRRGIEADHLKTVGSGGQDASNLWPVCPGLHDLRHQKGPKYIDRRFGIELRLVVKISVPSIVRATPKPLDT